MSIWVEHGGEGEHQVQRLETSRKVCGLNHGLEREKPQLFIWAKWPLGSTAMVYQDSFPDALAWINPEDYGTNPREGEEIPPKRDLNCPPAWVRWATWVWKLKQYGLERRKKDHINDPPPSSLSLSSSSSIFTIPIITPPKCMLLRVKWLHVWNTNSQAQAHPFLIFPH